MTQRDEEYRLVGDIYDAATNPALWPAIIERVAAIGRVEKANLLAYDHLNPDVFLFHSHGVTPEQLQAYQDGGYAAMDMEFSSRWIADGSRDDQVVTNHEYFGSVDKYAEAAGSLYKDFFSGIGIHYQCAGLLEKTDYRWAVLGLHRSRDAGPFEQEVTAAITRLMPHFRRAMRIHRQLTTERQRNARLYRILDGLVVGVLLLDGEGRVRYANARAEQLLQQNPTLTVDRRQVFAARHPAQQGALQQLMQQARQTSRRVNDDFLAGGVLGIDRGKGRAPLMLTVNPLSVQAGHEELASDAIATVVFMSDPESGHTLSRQLLRQAFSLSERESVLCEAFLNHASLERSADTCGLSVETVRTYMKSIYEKTGKHSQAELMQLLMAMTRDFEHLR